MSSTDLMNTNELKRNNINKNIKLTDTDIEVLEKDVYFFPKHMFNKSNNISNNVPKIPEQPKIPQQPKIPEQPKIPIYQIKSRVNKLPMKFL